MTRQCNKCKLVKPKTDFYKCKTYLQTQCKSCIIENSKARHKRLQASGNEEYKQNNTIKSRKSSLKLNYNLTENDFIEMLKQQNHECAVCGIEQVKCASKFNIDHCHKTGKIRGLLCYACNRAEGFIKSDPSIAIKLAEYLTKHRENT